MLVRSRIIAGLMQIWTQQLALTGALLGLAGNQHSVPSCGRGARPRAMRVAIDRVLSCVFAKTYVTTEEPMR